MILFESKFSDKYFRVIMGGGWNYNKEGHDDIWPTMIAYFFLRKLDIGPGRRQGFVERRLKGGDAAGRQVHLSILLELVPRMIRLGKQI